MQIRFLAMFVKFMIQPFSSPKASPSQCYQISVEVWGLSGSTTPSLIELILWITQVQPSQQEQVDDISDYSKQKMNAKDISNVHDEWYKIRCVLLEYNLQLTIVKSVMVELCNAFKNLTTAQ